MLSYGAIGSNTKVWGVSGSANQSKGYLDFGNSKVGTVTVDTTARDLSAQRASFGTGTDAGTLYFMDTTGSILWSTTDVTSVTKVHTFALTPYYFGICWVAN